MLDGSGDQISFSIGKCHGIPLQISPIKEELVRSTHDNQPLHELGGTNLANVGTKVLRSRNTQLGFFRHPDIPATGGRIGRQRTILKASAMISLTWHCATGSGMTCRFPKNKSDSETDSPSTDGDDVHLAYYN